MDSMSSSWADAIRLSRIPERSPIAGAVSVSTRPVSSRSAPVRHRFLLFLKKRVIFHPSLVQSEPSRFASLIIIIFIIGKEQGKSKGRKCLKGEIIIKISQTYPVSICVEDALTANSNKSAALTVNRLPRLVDNETVVW